MAFCLILWSWEEILHSFMNLCWYRKDDAQCRPNMSLVIHKAMLGKPHFLGCFQKCYESKNIEVCTWVFFSCRFGSGKRSGFKKLQRCSVSMDSVNERQVGQIWMMSLLESNACSPSSCSREGPKQNQMKVENVLHILRLTYLQHPRTKNRAEIEETNTLPCSPLKIHEEKQKTRE